MNDWSAIIYTALGLGFVLTVGWIIMHEGRAHRQLSIDETRAEHATEQLGAYEKLSGELLEAQRAANAKLEELGTRLASIERILTSVD